MKLPKSFTVISDDRRDGTPHIVLEYYVCEEVDAEVPLHEHVYEHNLVTMAGSFRIEIGEKHFVLPRDGLIVDMIRIPANKPHRVVCLSTPGIIGVINRSEYYEERRKGLGTRQLEEIS